MVLLRSAECNTGIRRVQWYECLRQFSVGLEWTSVMIVNPNHTSIVGSQLVGVFALNAKIKVVTGLAVLAATGFTVLGITSQAHGSPISSPRAVNGVNQAALQRCITSAHANCESQIPRLSKCMASGLTCNAASQVGVVEPPTMASVRTRTPLISRSSALADAYRFGAALQAHITSSTKAVAKQMTNAAADALTRQVINPALAANYPVWVVSVAANVTNLFGIAGRPEATQPFYTVVLDGYTGRIIMSASGVDSLNAAAS